MNNACCRDNDLVGDHMLSWEGSPQTYQAEIEISSNTGSHQMSVDHIIMILSLPSTHRKTNVSVWLLMYSR